MLDVTENGLSILRSERVELGEHHLVRDKVLPKKKSCICPIIISFFFNLILFLNLKHCISFAKHQNESATGIHSSILFFSFMNQIVPKAK